ncbi:aminoglycoside phosphotransferase family protein [Rhizobium herbae]|uniref:Streptomycin 6-kinase n=1 Tax=Rhizobium herbae TaxID=508661 RepID=A0ABS4ESU5_9HYPH|nr:aminoglycoside phosphotransferase family protein [Rhizobium herbae]MBP1861028.1 streptomycin 6-kinase [Rhizobium herbae]
MFDPYIKAWGLTPDGAPVVTHSSRLLPVRWQGLPAMLKVATIAEETRGGLLMQWWDGEGAAKVYARDGEAILLERAEGKRSLLFMAMNGEDDAASRIICRTVQTLHRPPAKPYPELVPLDIRFRALEAAASAHGGMFGNSNAVAKALLAMPQEIGVLHGDIHHGNILDFEDRGWLAIDPKGLFGERGYDYANLFCNPDPAAAKDPARLRRQLPIVVRESGLAPERLLRWILAYAGLSAAWSLEDGDDPAPALHVAEIAAAELASGTWPVSGKG